MLSGVHVKQAAKKNFGYISLKSWYTLISMALKATTMLWFTSPVDHWSVLPH